MITTKQLLSKYGAPTQDGKPYLTKINLPYPMRIAWDTKTTVNTTVCHKLIAPNLTNVLKDILAHYGLDEIKRLGIDLYGGCFMYRRMRGGTEWSRHSWGVAVDLDPARNQLKQSGKTAQFAKASYKPMIDIFYKHGFLSLGKEKDYDWMHFEIAK